jgi:hypothetical protein
MALHPGSPEILKQSATQKYVTTTPELATGPCSQISKNIYSHAEITGASRP